MTDPRPTHPRMTLQTFAMAASSGNSYDGIFTPPARSACGTPRACMKTLNTVLAPPIDSTPSTTAWATIGSQRGSGGAGNPGGTCLPHGTRRASPREALRPGDPGHPRPRSRQGPPPRRAGIGDARRMADGGCVRRGLQRGGGDGEPAQELPRRLPRQRHTGSGMPAPQPVPKSRHTTPC